MITPSFSTTATERVLPKLALDFTTASLDPRVTFTRTTGASNPATYVASTGYVTAATNNQPRFDFDPVALTCKGLLIEESRANLVLQSSSFDNASWVKIRLQPFGSGSVADATISPDGTQNADKIVEDTTASNSHQLVQAVSSTTNTNPYTFTVFAKKDTRTYINLAVFEGTTFAREGDCTFDLTAGTAGSVATGGGATASATITDFGNGWYRCSVTVTLGGTDTNIQLRIRLATASGWSYTGDGTSGLYVWGAQLEAGAFPTSYIPTTTTALTRNADVATMTGTNFSDWFNATQGTFVAEYTIPYALGTGGTPRVLSINGAGGSTVDEIALYLIQASGKAASANTWAAGVNPGRLDSAQSFVAGTKYKGVLAYSSNRQLTTNATAPTVNATVYTIPTVTSMNIGSNSVTANGTNGWISKVWYYKQSLTTAEVQAFSK